MSYETFAKALKSTIDFNAKQLADELDLPFLDLSDIAIDPAVIDSDQPAICWELDSIEEYPIDPLWSADFDIGAMTILDPSQYTSFGISGAIANKFKKGVSYEIFDYSGATVPTQSEGRFFVTHCGTTPQQQDQLTNLRFVSVSIRATRNV